MKNERSGDDREKEVTRKLLFDYARVSKNWQISGGASVAETLIRDNGDGFREREFGLETSFEVSPQDGEKLTFDAKLDCEDLPDDHGLTVEEALLRFSYKLRF